MRKQFLAITLLLMAQFYVAGQPSAYSASPPSARYRVLDLGDLEQTSNGVVRAINSAGDVVGATSGLGTGTRAFVLTKKQFEIGRAHV